MRFFVITILFLSILLIGCETTQETMKPEPEPEPEPTQVVSVIKGAPPPQLPEPGVIRSQAEIMRILREAGHKNYADKIKETGIFESAEKRQRRPVVNIIAMYLNVGHFRDVDNDIDISVLIVETPYGEIYEIYTLHNLFFLLTTYSPRKYYTFNVIKRGQDTRRGTIMAEFP